MQRQAKISGKDGGDAGRSPSVLQKEKQRGSASSTMTLNRAAKSNGSGQGSDHPTRHPKNEGLHTLLKNTLENHDNILDFVV